MTEMICRELALRKDYLGSTSIESVYFGGGTPSLLPIKNLHKILDVISKLYTGHWKEVTLESNPDDLKEENLRNWKSLGIDRLSLGIQSFDDEILSFYNRAHTAKESKESIQKARKLGFEKFSIDLMYGFPYPDHSAWKRDLTEAIAQETGHISSYALTIEPKTTLEKWVKKGSFIAAEDEFVAQQFEYLQEQTEKAGYIQYEVASFGKPGQFALHNSNYWRGVPYLGVGPSAHSFDGHDRGSNPSNNSSYLKLLNGGQIPFIIEPLVLDERLNEYILTGLRTIWGINFDHILSVYNHDLKAEKKQILEKMNGNGWLIWGENTLSLSRTGKLLADGIAAALFV